MHNLFQMIAEVGTELLRAGPIGALFVVMAGFIALYVLAIPFKVVAVLFPICRSMYEDSMGD